MIIDHELERAKQMLLAGGVVAIPTETVYGLAAAINSEEGIKKIFAIKERPFFDPLIVHIYDLEQKGQVISDWPEIADFLAKRFWPGPFTMVLPKAKQLNPMITAGLETVGVRMPAHPVARTLINKCGIPLAAPSANKFGKTSPTKAEHVIKGFEKDELMVLDGGQSEIGLESTVVAFSRENDRDIINILRPGAITKDLIETALNERGKPYEIIKSESQASPGHTEHHYMPNIPLVIVDQEQANLKQATHEAICSEFQFERNARGAELRLDANPRIAARSLYLRMRECADSGASFIYVFRRQEQRGGIWDAIWDRLERASSRTYVSS